MALEKKKEKPKLNSSSQHHFSTKKECSENDKLYLFFFYFLVSFENSKWLLYHGVRVLKSQFQSVSANSRFSPATVISGL